MSDNSPIMNTKDILAILPHRYPFLLVDKIIAMDLDEGTIVGQKNVTMNEQFFQGHFPNAPIMPGVLILESLAQTGAVLVSSRVKSDAIAVLLKISNAKFRHAVHPGDILLLHIEGRHLSDKGGRVFARATVDGKIAAEAEISFALVPKENI